MKPNRLYLEGFIGIRHGRGRNSIEIIFDKLIPVDARLVAFTGPNGAGKTTILDNMHPFRIMPSQCKKTYSADAFSYWTHISGPSAKKELDWTQDGIDYRSIIAFKNTGKTKTADAYLLKWNRAANDWKPVELPDGTLSDGKTATYDRCVEAILGSPETFFTSIFAAQNRRALSAYSSTEIKALLASVLNYGDLQAKAAKANMVGRMLKLELDQLQDVLAQARGAAANIEQVNQEIVGFDKALEGRAEVEQAEQVKIDEARKALALLEAKRDALAQDEEQRTFLNQQIRTVQAELEEAQKRAEDQYRKDMQVIIQNRHRATDELAKEKAKQAGITAEISRLKAIIGRRMEIEAASAAVPALRNNILQIDSDIEANQVKIDALRPIRQELSQDTAKAEGIATAGAEKAKFIITLKQTAELINQVPCHGMDIQRTCSLLENANKAQAKIEPEENEVKKARQEYRELKQRIDANKKLIEDGAVFEEQAKSLAATRREKARLLEKATQTAGEAPVLADAQKRLPELEQSVQAFEQMQAAYAQSMRDMEAAEREHESVRKTAIDSATTTATRKTAELRERLAKLAAPVTEAELVNARARLQAALHGLNTARVTTKAYQDQRNDLAAKLTGLKSILASTQETTLKAENFGNEIAKWKRIEHGCGNNGLIALSIDDAGPEITAYCNELLTECYGPRFSVQIDTQKETQVGNMRETFDIKVYDANNGDSKSLTLMSGGEQVWINECLSRAIALYGVSTSGKKFQTIFTDETDGALDPEKKREFISMKRAVQTQGGYEREYYISHNRESQDLADFQLDVSLL